ncbi:uncharacterized protein LOC143229642 [Tachypleus tridentatus]|uniref:uncharacterized protein LOC143229642 n=1 Tax=Tachypleus tridentatus TaxID=6853 RepID=UPI003FD2FAAF
MPKEEKRCGPRIKYTSVVPRDTSIKLSDSILKPKRETKCGPKIKFTPIRLKEGKSSPQIQYFLQSVIKIPKICIRKLDSEDSVQAEDKQISASKDVQDEDMMQISANKSTWGEAAKVNGNKSIQDEDMMQISANKSTWGEAAKVNGNKSIQDEDMMQISANKSTWDEDMMQISANKSTWDEDMMQISANKSMWDEDMMQISANKSIRDEAVKEVSVYKSIQDEAKKQVSANKSLQEEMKKQINANKVKKSKSRKKIILEKNERVKLKKKKKKQTFEAAKEVSVYKSIQDKAKKQVSANKNLQEEMKKQTNANKVKKPKSRKKIISEKNKRVKRKKKKKKQTFSLLSKIKAGSSKAILCSLHCVDRNFELPSLHCGICLCLFHPECVGIPPSSHPSTFICQFCRKNVKRKVLLLPPGVCPLMPQEFHILNQTNPLYNGRAEEETLMPAETNIRPNTTIPPVPEVVLTKEPSVKEGSIGNNTPKASGPLKTSLAAISNLEHQTISPFPSAPLRHNLSQTQNLISRNSLGGDNMGQISNASSASSSNEVPNSVVQNMLYSPVNTQTSFCRPASSPVSQSPSHVIGSVSGAVVTSLPLSSSSTPHLLQALSTPPLSRAGNGPIAHAGKSQPIQRTHKNLLLPAYRTVANTPLLPDGFLATSPAGRPATEISNSSLPICSASSELQPVTNLVMCSSGSNICLTSTMPVVSSLDTAVLPQVLTVRPFVCSTFPFASNSSTFKVKIQKSNPFQAYNVVLSERMCGSNIKTTGTTSTTVTDNVSFTVSESVAVEKKTISSHTKEVSQATIPFVSSQIETISPLPKEESMVLENETSSVQTEFDKQSVQSEIELKEVKVTLVKLPEVMFNYSVKSQASKENLKIQIPNPLLCHINRLVGGFDCINDIFQYLGVMDLLRASQVSRSWKNIARQSNLWKSVCLKGLHITSWARCAKALEQFHTTSLDLRDVKHREDHVTFWHSFIQCLEHLKNIRYLTFGVVVPEVLPAVFGTITQLQTLRAECVTEAIEPSVWIMLCKIDFIKMGRLTNLNSLWIRGGGGLQLSPLLSSGSLWCLGNLTLLRHLHLTTLVGAPSESFQFLEKLLLLESLAIGDCYSWNSWNYSCLGKLKHLKKLRLEKGGQLNDPSLQNALSNLTCLEELQLLCFVIPSNLGSALEKLQNLSQLVIWPDIYKQAPRVNQNTIEAVSSLKTLHKFSWGVMSLPSEMNNEDNTFDKQKMISFLRHKENCQCSCNKNSSKTQINPECIVRVHLEEFEQQLRNLFTNTRITVYSVPMESFNRFCSSFR